ncbi:MAG: hypothetical protein NXI01_00615 [Gammaproteobacteria bacterium]|nr:hypothetical protein [Gammaproteobacteria bacterium]
MPFEKKRDIPIVIAKAFIGMSEHLSHIQNAAPNIRNEANRHIPAGITFILRKAFSKVPPSDRGSLYRSISKFFHPDTLEIRHLNLSIPEHEFLNFYLDWLKRQPEGQRADLKNQLMHLLTELKNEHESDFDYRMHYKSQHFSLSEKTYLDALNYKQYYPKIINISLSCIKILCLFAVIMALALALTLIPIWILVKIAPILMANHNVQGYLMLQISYSVDVYVKNHFSFIYVLMFGEKIYKQALQETVSEQELAKYLRLKYASEIDLSTETNERVFAYSKAMQLDTYCSWDDDETQAKKSSFMKALPHLYDMKNFLLLEQYISNLSLSQHAKFLVSAMYKTLKTSLPSQYIAWTTHQKMTHNTKQYILYVKETSRTHKIVQLNEKEVKTSVTFEPWGKANHSNTIHIIDDALYCWNTDAHKIQKLHYHSEELLTLPDNIVRTTDSLFMRKSNHLIRLDIDSPSGMPPKSQYILMQDRLFFYDSLQDKCTIISDNAQCYIEKFPVGTQIAALSNEDKHFISKQNSHAIRSWHWTLLQSSVVLILRALFFIPFLTLDMGTRLLMKLIPCKIRPQDALTVADYGITRFFKLPLDIYRYFQAPESHESLEVLTS